MDAVDSEIEGQDSNMTQVDAASVYTLPAGADFLMCYSVAEGMLVFNTDTELALANFMQGSPYRCCFVCGFVNNHSNCNEICH